MNPRVKSVNNGMTITLAMLSVLFGVISCNKKEAPRAPKNMTAVAYDDHIQLSWDVS